MLSVRYNGLRITPSLSAMRELMHEGRTMFDILKILKEGYIGRKRKEGTIEKWLDRKNKTYNAVIVKDYDNIMKEEI